MADYQNRGYLDTDFRLFHIRDQAPLNGIGNHYHDFYKLLLFAGGTASYVVEGRHYALMPGDMVLVEQGCVHRPETVPGCMYDRYLLYLSADFLRQNSRPDCDLTRCFQLTASCGHILRHKYADFRELFAAAWLAVGDSAYGGDMLARLRIMEILVRLARLMEQPEPVRSVYDSKVVELITYINEHLTADLTIDALAERFHVSKYHMMRRFRSETGYSIHDYIAQKRLLFARTLLAAGSSATEAAYRCGYQDYSTFSRAFKRLFGVSPKQYLPQLRFGTAPDLL